MDQEGCALRHMTPQMQANKHVVGHAVANNGMALQFASDALQDDPEVPFILILSPVSLTP